MELLARRRRHHGPFVAPLPSRSCIAADGGAHRGSHVLHAAARAGLVRPARVEWQPPARLSRYRHLLRRLPDPPRVIWAALGLVALIAIALRAVGVEQMPALQNVYLVPVLWAALTRGTLGGILTGLGAGLVQSLSIFPFIERVGLSWPALGGVLSLSTPLTLGLTVGRLMDRSRGRDAQLDALLSIQRSLADSASLAERLGAVAELTRAALGVDRVRLVLENARLTERQRHFAQELEEKVAGATRRLRELDQAKNEFLSIASHELRTPLTALQGFSELLLTRDVPPERARRYLGHLHTESQRLGRIVGDVLDLSRIESGRGPTLERVSVDLGAMIKANVEIFASQHPRHQFEWKGRKVPALCADRDAVDRMLKNLLSNAIKYSPRGGRVRVEAGPAADKPEMVEFTVEDDGVGIPAEALPRIFDAYVRIANPETASAPGLGLGLSLVRGLAHAHGGSVEVESLPGKGSRFRVLLPR